MVERGKDDEVLEGHGCDIVVVADGERRCALPALVVCMHRTIVREAHRLRASRVPAIPVFGMLLAIGPIRTTCAIVGQASLAAVVGELDGEFTIGGQFENLAVFRGDLIASTVVLEPPVFFGEHVERVDDGVGVAVVNARIVAAFAVHAILESSYVSRYEGREAQCEKCGAKHGCCLEMV